MEHKCNICNKVYSGYQSLWIHNKKYHTSTVQNSSKSVELPVQNCSNRIIPVQNCSTETKKSLSCEYCNKIFNCRSSKSMHKKTCKTKVNLADENKKLKEENSQLKTQTVPINNQTINNNNGIMNKNNGTINNNQTNTINKNNYMYINQVGNEKINLTPKEIKLIVSDGLNGAMTCVRNINFNKKKPENHSFYSSSLEGQFCTAINEKTQKPETVPKKEIVDKVLESSFKILEGISIQIECNDDFRERFTDEEIKQLHNIIDNKKKFYEKKNRKIFHNSVISMSYTFKNLILSTWKLLEPDYEEDDTDDNSVPDITEVHYYPGDGYDDDKKSDCDSDEEFSFKIL